MKALTVQASLAEQAYAAIVDAICEGSIASGTHLVQEQLAERLGVSRQPIQQALLLLRSDGIVVDAGRRGLVVAPLDVAMMRDRYQVRGALDELAARLAARRCAASAETARAVARDGGRILHDGRAAAETRDVPAMIRHDVAFHAFLYEASGNAVLGPTAEVHWRYMRRVMGEVYRNAEPGAVIWQQHGDILAAVVAGDDAAAARLAAAHVERATESLAAVLALRT